MSPWALRVAAMVSVVLLLYAAGYGFHRDELYFIIAGRHPALGYVDQPPLTPILSAAAVALLGSTPVAVRILPALVTGLAIAMCADMARRFGGRNVRENPMVQVTVDGRESPACATVAVGPDAAADAHRYVAARPRARRAVAGTGTGADLVIVRLEVR